jgi:hypothetical protein
VTDPAQPVSVKPTANSHLRGLHLRGLFSNAETAGATATTNINKANAKITTATFLTSFSPPFMFTHKVTVN